MLQHLFSGQQVDFLISEHPLSLGTNVSCAPSLIFLFTTSRKAGFTPYLHYHSLPFSPSPRHANIFFPGGSGPPLLSRQETEQRLVIFGRTRYLSFPPIIEIVRIFSLFSSPQDVERPFPFPARDQVGDFARHLTSLPPQTLFSSLHAGASTESPFPAYDLMGRIIFQRKRGFLFSSEARHRGTSPPQGSSLPPSCGD